MYDFISATTPEFLTASDLFGLRQSTMDYMLRSNARAKQKPTNTQDWLKPLDVQRLKMSESIILAWSTRQKSEAHELNGWV